ncbi:MAG: hypothetical protein MJZ72_08770, partial [Bacteroidales bacterium]|nr:hypothetical protein [Bacteroidales bacterium]
AFNIEVLSSESNKPWLPSFLYALLYVSIFSSNLRQIYEYLFDYQRVLFRNALKTKTGTNHKKKLKYHKTIMCPFLRTIFLAG